MGYFQIKTATNGQYYFILKSSGNHETLLTSERYTTKSACQNGIDSVKTNAPIDDRYDRRIANNGQYYFNLKASNGQVIGTSEMYTTLYSRDNGISAVKQEAPFATIQDLS